MPSFRLERLLVRVSTLALLTVASLSPAWMAQPRRPPDYALQSELILYLERSFVVFALAYFAFTIVVRGLSRGAVPHEVSREGFKWAEDVAQSTADAIEGLQRQIDSLSVDVRVLADRFALRASGAP